MSRELPKRGKGEHYDLKRITLLHVAVSLIRILAGFVVVAWFLTAKRRDNWTALFLSTTVLTSITGFLFPIPQIFALTRRRHRLLARLGADDSGSVLLSSKGSVAPNICHRLRHRSLSQRFCFDRPALKALAPTQSERPFLGTQVVAMLIFIVLGVLAAKRSPAVSISSVGASTHAIPRESEAGNWDSGALSERTMSTLSNYKVWIGTSPSAGSSICCICAVRPARQRGSVL